MEAIGIAWIGNGFRPIFSAREIRRGKNKGKLEVTYRKRASHIAKIIIREIHKDFRDEAKAPD